MTRPRSVVSLAVDAADERFDAEKLDVLRRWGRGLGDDTRDEVRAAGRAITMLIEEIERLHVELWHARDTRAAAAEAAVDDPPAGGPPDGETLEATLAVRLRERLALRRIVHRRPSS